MGVLLVIAMLTYMKETEVARFLVQIDGTEGCSSDTSARALVKVLKYRVFPNIRELDNVGTMLAAFVKALRAEFVKQNGSYAENGDGEFAAGYLAGFLKDVLDGASPTTWTPHPSSHNKKILDFLKGDLNSLQEETLWRRAKLYNTFAKLQE